MQFSSHKRKTRILLRGSRSTKHFEEPQAGTNLCANEDEPQEKHEIIPSIFLAKSRGSVVSLSSSYVPPTLAVGCILRHYVNSIETISPLECLLVHRHFTFIKFLSLLLWWWYCRYIDWFLPEVNSSWWYTFILRPFHYSCTSFFPTQQNLPIKTRSDLNVAAETWLRSTTMLSFGMWNGQYYSCRAK